jgi:transposase, IS6 family
VITTDQNPAYGEALRQLKRDDPNVETLRHRQAKYLNNRIEADHGPIKRLCRATLGFKSMKTAYATIKGFEVMRLIRKRQCITLLPGITGEVRFVAKLFGVFA